MHGKYLLEQSRKCANYMNCIGLTQQINVLISSNYYYLIISISIFSNKKVLLTQSSALLEWLVIAYADCHTKLFQIFKMQSSLRQVHSFCSYWLSLESHHGKYSRNQSIATLLPYCRKSCLVSSHVDHTSVSSIITSLLVVNLIINTQRMCRHNKHGSY